MRLAQRGADGELAFAACGADEQQISHVGAGDQQDQAHGTQQDKEGFPGLVHDGIAKGLDREFEAGILDGIQAKKLLERELQLRVGLLQRDARLETRRNPKEVALVGAVGLELEGDPQLRLRIGHEVSPEDADDCVGLASQRQRTPDHIGIAAEPPLPESVTQHNHIAAVGHVLLGRKGPPEDHARAVDAEIGFADMNAMHHLRPAAGDVEARPAEIVRAHIFEDAGLPLILVKFRDRCDVGVAALPAHLDGDDAVCVGVGQRLQQHRIDHGKDRRICADAQRQSRSRGNGKAGTLREHLQRVFDVFAEVAHSDAPAWP